MSAHGVEAVLDALAAQRGERGLISTATLNLIAFVEDANLLELILARIDTLGHKHPSRSIILDAARSESGHSVHSERKEIGETLLTQTEQIRLNAGSIGAAELRSLVHGLLVPNVPSTLFWAGKHLDDDRFRALAHLSHNVVIDSSRIASDARYVRELVGICGSGLEHAVHDLAYMRLLPWQDMVAQFFDDADLSEELPSISQVEVEAGSDCEAYYLFGWLASRLRWAPCAPHEFCNAEGDRIRTTIVRKGQPRRVQSISLKSANSVFRAGLDEKTPDIACLTVTGAKHRPPRCSPLHDVDVVSLLEHAILVPDSGTVFVETLEMVRTLMNVESA